MHKEKAPSGKFVNEGIEAVRAGGGNPDLLSEEIIADATRLSFKLAAALKLPLPDKQAFLESNSLEDRLRNLVRLIGEKKQSTDHLARLHKKATQNGHPKNPGS